MQKVLVSGEFACFTRPELSVERYSYDVPTPSACIGVLDAIYRKPEMRWHIARIHVLKPIRRESLRRKELARKATLTGGPIDIDVTDNVMLRHASVLRDVAYVIEARIEALDGNPAKHVDTFRRRLDRGQCFQQPFLGCREFICSFAPVPQGIPRADASLAGHRDLGFMLHSIDYSTVPRGRRWYHASMTDGVIDVPALGQPSVMA
jgi:CRISPR-associated protein Cas5d